MAAARQRASALESSEVPPYQDSVGPGSVAKHPYSLVYESSVSELNSFEIDPSSVKRANRLGCQYYLTSNLSHQGDRDVLVDSKAKGQKGCVGAAWQLVGFDGRKWDSSRLNQYKGRRSGECIYMVDAERIKAWSSMSGRRNGGRAVASDGLGEAQ